MEHIYALNIFTSKMSRVSPSHRDKKVSQYVTLTFSTSQLRTFYIHYVLRRLEGNEVVQIESREIDEWESFVRDAMKTDKVLKFLGDWFFDLHYD